MAMTTRQNTKTITVPSATMASATEESVPERVTQRKPEGGRFRLQVDRQTKGSYATYSYCVTNLGVCCEQRSMGNARASLPERPPISVALLQSSSERGVQAAMADPLDW